MLNISPNFEITPILTLSILFSVGLVAGRIARGFRVPTIVGQIIIGIITGTTGISLFSYDTISSLDLVTEFAFGLVALFVGDKLNFSRLRNAGKRLAVLLIAESTFIHLLVFVSLRFVIKIEFIPSLICAFWLFPQLQQL